MRRKALCAAAPACLLLGLSPLAAYADTTPATPAPGTPAPASSASATAARVSDLIHISDTNARADASKGSAQATVISIAGQPFIGTGHSQTQEGESHGALLDTGTLPVHLEVAPWRTAVTGSSASTHRHSRSEAALARADAFVVKATVLGSHADADHTSEKSTGMSTSDAADVSIGDAIRLVLLHSEVSSMGKGSSYLIGLNGNDIGTSDQLGKSPLCALDASVASLSCLTAAGGVGSNGVTSGNAEVAAVKTALGVINPVDAFATSASSGIGTPPASILPNVGSVLPAETARSAAAAPAAKAPAALPRTGAAIASTLASGFAALVSGLGLSLFGRRRRRAA
jgi:LPXTG-motif cell wall-anchored protein